MKIKKRDGEEGFFVEAETGGMAFVKTFAQKVVESSLFPDVKFIQITGSQLTRWDEPNSAILVTSKGDYGKKDIDALFASENVSEPDTVEITGKYNGKRYSIKCFSKWSDSEQEKNAATIRFDPDDKDFIKAFLAEIGYKIR